MKNKINFFIKKKRVLLGLGLVSVLLIVVYLITFNSAPICNLSIDMANSIWSIIMNLACGYLISLIFYIMLVFNSEYNEEIKKSNISKRVYDYYLRIDTSIYIMIEAITSSNPHCECEDVDEYINKGLRYECIKNDLILYEDFKYATRQDIFKKAVKDINKNLNKIEPYLIFLNQKAIDIFINLQKTYIFENVDNDEKLGDINIFDMAVNGYMSGVLNVSEQLEEVRKNGARMLVE